MADNDEGNLSYLQMLVIVVGFGAVFFGVKLQNFRPDYKILMTPAKIAPVVPPIQVPSLLKSSALGDKPTLCDPGECPDSIRFALYNKVLDEAKKSKSPMNKK
jgi:hypothetical protein